LELKGYIVKRLILLLPTLWGVATFVFFLMHLIPGDPAIAIAGIHSTPEQIAAIRRRLNLDLPIYTQYFLWFWKLLHGNLGISAFSNTKVTTLILHAFPVTVLLASFAMFIAIIISIPLGIISAYKHNHITGRISDGFAIIGLSAPEFWLALIFIYFFAVKFRIFPAGGYISPIKNLLGCLRLLVLPAIAMGIPPMGRITRIVRSSTLDVLNSDYVRTARGKGLKESVVIIRHVLKNSLIPVITIIGMETGYLLGGSILIETIFFIPGMGRLLYKSVSTRDYTVVQGVVLFSAIVFVLSNLIVDVLYAWINPKIKYGK